MLLELAEVRQRDTFSCGSAVFACVTEYWEGRGRKFRSHPHYGTHPSTRPGITFWPARWTCRR